ncbi:MAG: ribosome small subunit-dependent GTPase A [Hyphomicrobium sp.]
MLEALGWNHQRRQEFQPYAADGLAPGRVVSEHRTHYQVATELAEISVKISGRFRSEAAHRTDLPGVGDFVGVRPSTGEGPGLIEAILTRTSAFVRKAAGETRPQLVAANVDFIFIVMALDGDFNLQRLERYLALAAESGAAPVIVINKADISHDAIETTGQISNIAPRVPIHIVSARSSRGMAELLQYFDSNSTIALVGSSGAGKSTMTNLFLGQDIQATQKVRLHDSRGRHTTTHRQLFIRPQGGAIIDTPGMRALELWEPSNHAEINFEDIEALAAQCRFRNCSHEREPACAVRAAVASGDLEAAHFANFVKRARS